MPVLLRRLAALLLLLPLPASAAHYHGPKGPALSMRFEATVQASLAADVEEPSPGVYVVTIGGQGMREETRTLIAPGATRVLVDAGDWGVETDAQLAMWLPCNGQMLAGAR